MAVIILIGVILFYLNTSGSNQDETPELVQIKLCVVYDGIY
jgi:hypothetical protein